MEKYLAEAHEIEETFGKDDSHFQYERYTEELEKASLCAERLAGELRRLVMESAVSSRRRREYQVKLIRSHWISIGYGEGILRAELPFLLPHRKDKYTDYLYEPLFLAMENWCEERAEEGLEIPVYGEGVVCFLHVYDKKKPEIRIRDHDNIEEKQVVDAMGTFFLTSDSGRYLDTYHTTAAGNEDRTEVFLMEKQRFPGWIGELYRVNFISKNQPVENMEKTTG